MSKCCFSTIIANLYCISNYQINAVVFIFHASYINYTNFQFRDFLHINFDVTSLRNIYLISLHNSHIAMQRKNKMEFAAKQSEEERTKKLDDQNTDQIGTSAKSASSFGLCSTVGLLILAAGAVA